MQNEFTDKSELTEQIHIIVTPIFFLGNQALGEAFCLFFSVYTALKIRDLFPLYNDDTDILIEHK